MSASEAKAPRRWRIPDYPGGPWTTYEEVSGARWDWLDDHKREILKVPEGIAFVRIVSSEEPKEKLA